MDSVQKEQIIKQYFNMWVKRDFTEIDTIMHTDIYYSECYGPEYQGMKEIQLWIKHMLAKQIVIEWKIKQCIHQNHKVVVEWFFKDQMDNVIHEFDGVSIIIFQDNKMISIKEFESKAEHITPYR